MTRRNIAIAIIIGVLAVPVLFYAGGVFMRVSHIVYTNFLFPNQVVMSAASPDGKCSAEVVKYMTLGGMGQKFRVKDAKGKRFTVGSTGDFNHARRIHWSPDSSTVVFEQYFNLRAVHPADRKVQSIEGKVYLDLESLQYDPIESLQFPQSGKLVIDAGEGIGSKTVDLKW